MVYTAELNSLTYRFNWTILDAYNVNRTYCNQNFRKRESFRLPSALVAMTHSVRSGQRLSAINLTHASRHVSAGGIFYILIKKRHTAEKQSAV